MDGKSIDDEVRRVHCAPMSASAPRQNRIVFSGLTGFVGSRLALRLLLDGRSLVPIVRAASPSAAMERARQALELAAHALGCAPPSDLQGRWDLVVANLAEARLGGVVRPLAGERAELWHLAASPHPGTRACDQALLESALDLARELECSRFVTVSGAGSGAECWITAVCRASGLPCVVLELPNLLGASTTYRVCGNHRGLFALAAQGMRLPDEHAEYDYGFACVDHALEDMLGIPENAEPGVSVQAIPISVAWSGATICEELAASKSAARNATSAPGYEDRWLSRVHTDVAPAAHDGRPRITVEDLRTYLLSFELETKGTRRWKRSSVARAGGNLTAYEFAPTERLRPCVILVNAYGVLAEAFTLLADTLSSEARVVTWETAGLPDLRQGFEPLDCGLARQSADLEMVLNHYGAKSAHVIGWCTGGLVAAYFAQERPSRVLSLTMVNPSLPIWDNLLTEVQVAGARTWPALSRSRRLAALAFQVLHTPPPKEPSNAEAGRPSANAAYAGLFLSSDRMQQRYARGASRHPEALYRYACLSKSFFADAGKVTWSEVRARALLICATQDPLTGTAAAGRAAEQMVNAEYREFVGSHFDVCARPEIAQGVKAFIAPSSGGVREGMMAGEPG